MVSRFDETLHLMDPDTASPVAGLRAGPCARGPVDAGSSVLWMEVWFFQRTPSGVAVATGRSGEDVGGPDEQPPYAQGRWMIRTGLSGESARFSPALPASAMAIAVVLRPDGTKDVEQWFQGVALRGGGPHH